MNNLKKHLVISPEVQDALDKGKPVVALESTIISHGMPYPQNAETANRVEKTVRDNGAIPATTAIIGGKLKVGLTAEEIDYFGKGGFDIKKVSRRDIAATVAMGIDGATTVTTTMMLADFAGIPIMATGGIGGVHRGAQQTLDVSADLEELASSSVMVVCAGAKSILDIGLTLEYLETHGVPVMGYGTDVFPEFYTRGKGYGVDCKLNSALDAAKVYAAKRELGLRGGMVVANPIPEQFAMDYDFIEAIIAKAVSDAEKQGIKGKNSTPFILSEVHKNSEHKSLDANIELVVDNTRVASLIACELSKMK